MFHYLRKVIDKNSPERVNAFLAVVAGLCLCFGFFLCLGAIVFYQMDLKVELGSMIAGLTALATFSKVDRPEPPKLNTEN